MLHLSCCKHRIMPTAYRFRMYQGNGSTCPHARIRSSLISAKVRARCPLYTFSLTSCCPPSSISCPYPVFSRMRFGTHDLGCVDLRRAHRVREGHSRPRTGDTASRASPCCGHLAAVFNSILPEPCAKCAAQRACVTM
jgi:hypothetical protein